MCDANKQSFHEGVQVLTVLVTQWSPERLQVLLEETVRLHGHYVCFHLLWDNFVVELFVACNLGVYGEHSLDVAKLVLGEDVVGLTDHDIDLNKR